MYAKLFNQIFDSSIADDYRLRHFFMDFIVLADPNGVVDMTMTSIAARTRIPIEEVRENIAKLEAPDLESRTPDHDGRRIKKLDEHRSWGWCILNYDKFRQTASEEQRREKTRERVNKYRAKDACNAPVTHGNACNAMQKQRQKEKQREIEEEDKGASTRAPEPLEDLVLKTSTEIPDEATALSQADTRGIPRDFSRLCYADWFGNNGCDSKNTPKPWMTYLDKRWRYEQGDWKAGTHRGKQSVTSKPRTGPTHAEVSAYAKEKWPDGNYSHWASSFYGYWADQKRAWKKNGIAIDWKVELGAQVSKWRQKTDP